MHGTSQMRGRQGAGLTRAQRRLRCGSAQVFKRVGRSAIRLLLVPGICEAFFDGGIAIPIFGMPPLFAFALGFILKAVGPALVIQCMFEVQQKRLGTLKCARLTPFSHPFPAP